MTPTASAAAGTRRAYDHRLREHVIRCGGKSIVKHVQIPRSTVSSWRRRGLRPVVTTEPFGLNQQHVFDSGVRWEKQARVLAAVVRLLLALLRASGFGLLESVCQVAKPKLVFFVPWPAPNCSSLSR